MTSDWQDQLKLTKNLHKKMNIYINRQENNKKASEVFASIDVNGDGEINGPELYKGLIEHIGHHLSPGQVSMIINALDTNDDNRIDLAELSAALEEEE